MDNTRKRSRRRNYLQRVLAVQEAYQAAKRPGIPDAYVYRTAIYPRFFICERTFREYLEINAKRELKEYE